MTPAVEAATCTKCGRVENIDLLDGGGEAFGKAKDAIECVACYGPEWLPMQSLKNNPSICSDLAPYYAAWAANTPEWLQ